MKLYYSLNVSNIDKSKKIIDRLNKGDYLFISLHTQEDVNSSYVKNTIKLLELANKKHAKVIADISKRTLTIFKAKSLDSLYCKLHLYAFRIDYGFTIKEIKDIAKKYPVVINASTLDEKEIIDIKKNAKELIAMHNFYPRPETGLDILQFLGKSFAIKKLNIPLYAFIKGDIDLRGPLNLGLPTLEHQRDYLPHVAFIELDRSTLLDGVFTADNISDKELKLINFYRKENVIPLITNLKDKKLLNKTFTVREDSPATLIRIKESREYATQGKTIKPSNTIERKLGSITLDNKLYKRYSGEVMITKSNYPKDKRVNVIGNIDKKSLPLLKIIKNKDKFIFIK